MKLTLSLALIVATLTGPALATAADRNAGPLWNQGDAQHKRPQVCTPPWSWSGPCRTTVPRTCRTGPHKAGLCCRCD